MRFKAMIPNTNFYHSFSQFGRILIHQFGRSDENGILTVPYTDRFINTLKRKFEVITEIPDTHNHTSEVSKNAPTRTPHAQTGVRKGAVQNGGNGEKHGRPGPKTNRSR